MQSAIPSNAPDFRRIRGSKYCTIPSRDAFYIRDIRLLISCGSCGALYRDGVGNEENQNSKFRIQLSQ